MSSSKDRRSFVRKHTRCAIPPAAAFRYDAPYSYRARSQLLYFLWWSCSGGRSNPVFLSTLRMSRCIACVEHVIHVQSALSYHTPHSTRQLNLLFIDTPVRQLPVSGFLCINTSRAAERRANLNDHHSILLYRTKPSPPLSLFLPEPSPKNSTRTNLISAIWTILCQRERTTTTEWVYESFGQVCQQKTFANTIATPADYLEALGTSHRESSAKPEHTGLCFGETSKKQ